MLVYAEKVRPQFHSLHQRALENYNTVFLLNGALAHCTELMAGHAAERLLLVDEQLYCIYRFLELRRA
jgi:hypothetical protein